MIRNTDFIKVHDIETTYDSVGRIYHVGDERFYSVTTMLGNCQEEGEDNFLDEWRERVGMDEAEKITRVAGQLGTDYHALGEEYLQNKQLPEVQWLAKHLFDKTIPILEKNIKAVHAVEIPLWSKVLRLAGRTDAVVDWNGELAIFDFKCIGHHNPDYLSSYWVQTAIYQIALKEMYNITATKLVLVVANKKSLKVKSFESVPKKHYKEAAKKIEIFRKNVKKC